MSGDYSRIAFDAHLDDLGVLIEQGRPLSDRDWSDLVLQLTRRIQAGTLDTLGAAVVPVQTPDGFEVQAAGGELTIGRGRIYVDGLLAENHGRPPDGGTYDWDPRLAELFGSEPLDYDQQPYYPNPPALPTGGSHLAYVDVWTREVNRFIRPEMIEPALGIDTSTRLQTVWQVKLLSLGESGATCATPLDQIPGWLPDHAPSAGRLSVTTVAVPGQPDPCLVSPPAGSKYTGLENQLYRLEIHTGGPPGTATFLWSRDNASVEAAVLEIPSLTQIVVDSVGKDEVLRFSDGDWVEITDDWLELHGLPGVLRKIKTGGGVDDATRTITLDAPLPSGQFPTDSEHLPAADRHTRIRRWDQKHKILDGTGAEIQDLDAQTSDGSITVPAGGVQVLLEHNIVASFSVQPTGGEFRTGDYWVFAARAADASVEELDAAPPRGIHHHYAKLAVVTFPDGEDDCRTFWPPAQTQPPVVEGDQCACTVCVTPAAHASGDLTVQMAIDQVIERGGGTVCLDVGVYALQQPLQVSGAQSLHVAGHGVASRLQGTGSLVRVTESRDVTLKSMALVSRPPQGTTPDAVLALASSTDVRGRELFVTVANDMAGWSAVGLSGALAGVSLCGCELSAPLGIRGGDETGLETGLTDLRIEDNTFDCQTSAVVLESVTVHQFVSHIRGNRVTGCSGPAVVLTGAAVPDHSLHVSGNSLTVDGSGIVAALDGVRIVDNDVRQAVEAGGEALANGIHLLPGVADDDSLDHVQIHGNLVAGFAGAGVLIEAPRVRSATIKQNRIERTSGGIVFEGAQELIQVAIENNQLSDIRGAGLRAESLEGEASLATSGNQVSTAGADPAVLLLFGRGTQVFADNQCRRAEAGDAADVVLGGDTMIVTSNRVTAGALSLDLRADERRYTAVGNVCAGRIIVKNGGPLPQPWRPLNLENVT